MKKFREHQAPVGNEIDFDPGDRFPAIVGAPEDAGSLFRDLDVAFVGLGSVGGATADLVARLAPRSMRFVDRGSYSPTSAWTHCGNGVGHHLVGRGKAAHVAGMVTRVSPSTRVSSFAGAYEDLDRGALFAGGLDAVFLSGDNLSIEVALGQDCLRFGVPLYLASLHGETLTAQCRAFAMRPGAEGACPACGFGVYGEWDRVGRDATFSCEPGKRAVRVPDPGRPPTRSLAMLCSTSANLAVGAFVRRTLGIDSAPPDCCYEYRACTHETAVTRLERNAECPCDHVPWSLRQIPGRLSMESLDDILEAAGTGLGGAAVSVEGYQFGRTGTCSCNGSAPLNRFVRPAGPGPTCRRCRHKVRPDPFFTATQVPGDWLEPVRRRRLRSLGAYSVPSVLVRREGRGVLIRGGSDDDHI